MRRPLRLVLVVLLAPLLALGATACSDDGEDADDVSTEARPGGEDGDGDESTTTTEEEGGDESSTTTTTDGGDETTTTAGGTTDTTASTAPPTDTSVVQPPSGDFCTAYDAMEETYADTFEVSQAMVDGLRGLSSLAPPTSPPTSSASPTPSSAWSGCRRRSWSRRWTASRTSPS